MASCWTSLILGLILCLISSSLQDVATVNDIIRQVTVDPEFDCGQQISCKNLTECEEMGVCGKTCRSERINFPTLHVLHRNGLREINLTTSKTTLSFSLDGMCNRPNCTILHLMDKNYSLYLVNNALMMNENFIINITTKSTIVFRSMQGTGQFFVEGKLVPGNFDMNISTVELDVITANIMDIEVNVYEDFLTNREIKDITDGTKLLDKCRCPSAYPEFDNGMCKSANTSQGLYENINYYSINEAVLDGNLSTKWTSISTNNFTFIIHLYDIYEIETVNIDIEEKNSSSVTMEIYNDNQWTPMSVLPNKNNSHIELTVKKNSTAGNEIRITFTETQWNESATQYVISEIKLSAKCACNGKADSCTAGMSPPPPYQSYSMSEGSCMCRDGYAGPTCSCECNTKGTERCDKGQCICKIGVTGNQCDKCIAGNSTCTNSPCNCTIPISVTPTFGPQSGGTTVTLNGTISSLPEVYIGEEKQKFTYINLPSLIKFKVSSSSVTGTKQLLLRWNSSTWDQPYKQQLKDFEYKPDPALFPNTNDQTGMLTAASGCMLKFTGTNLSSVHTPKIYYTANNIREPGSCCQSPDGSFFTCTMLKFQAPMIVLAKVDLECPNSNCVEWYNVSFVKPKISSPDMNVDYTDPFVEEITINGENFEACEKDNISITIGNKECEIIKVSSTSITCKPPTSPPTEEIVYTIQLQMGNEKKIQAGKITYKSLVNSIYFIYIMLGVVGFVFLLLIIIGTVCFWRRKSKTEKINNSFDMIHIPAPQNEYSTHRNNPLHNEVVHVETFEDLKTAFLRKLDHSLVKDVGESLMPMDTFTTNTPAICTTSGGKVRIIEGLLAKNNSKLTIKSLKTNLQVQSSFPKWVPVALKECIRFRMLKNTNVLSIIGICIEKKKFHILYHNMPNRTLKEYVTDESKDISLKELIIFGSQVVDGMIYLSANNVHHKDLAARNCMLDDKGEVKIADGSFSYDIFPVEYMHDEQRDRFLPVRWMAPESLSSGYYDSKSDVWSFGVLLWELLTRGCLPFVNNRDHEIQDMITDGYRLGKPDWVSDNVYTLLNICWEEMSEYRPTFDVLKEKLDEQLDDDPQEDYVNLSKPREIIYENSTSFKRKAK